MRDDPVQGILFNHDVVVDLATNSRHGRMIRKMLVTKQRLQGWITKPEVRSPIVKSAKPSPYLAVRSGKHRQADINALAGRLKGVS